jgi:hypothetical protein
LISLFSCTGDKAVLIDYILKEATKEVKV